MYEASCIGLLGALVNVVDPWAVSWTWAYHALHQNTLPALAPGGMAGWAGWDSILSNQHLALNHLELAPVNTQPSGTTGESRETWTYSFLQRQNVRQDSETQELNLVWIILLILNRMISHVCTTK